MDRIGRLRAAASRCIVASSALINAEVKHLDSKNHELCTAVVRLIAIYVNQLRNIQKLAIAVGAEVQKLSRSDGVAAASNNLLGLFPREERCAKRSKRRRGLQESRTFWYDAYGLRASTK